MWIARDQVSWNALMFCAVDEAGLMSDPIKVQLDYDAIGTLVPAEAGPGLLDTSHAADEYRV